MHAAECRSSLISLGRCDVSAGQPKGFGRSRGIGGDGQRTWEVTGKRGTLKNFYQNIIFYSSSCRKKKTHSLFSTESGAVSADTLAPRRLVQHLKFEKKKKSHSLHVFQLTTQWQKYITGVDRKLTKKTKQCRNRV